MRRFLFESENKLEDSDWKYLADHDEGGNVLNDPELRQKVLRATRRYFLDKFDGEDVLRDVRVSIVETNEDLHFEMPSYEVKIVAVFEGDLDSNGLRAINRRLERQLDADGEDREVSASISQSSDGSVRLVYLGPGIFDNAGKPFETREDYFRGIMIPIKNDIDTIYRSVGYDF
jgi:hypothetical protein